MSDSSNEEGFPSLRSVVKGKPSKKDRQIAVNADISGVCLVGKRDPRGRYRALCSGSVVRGLPEYGEKIFVITSENIVPNEELDQSGRKALNYGDYYVYFKRLDSSNKLKTYNLRKITNSKEHVTFTSGLAIIPIDSKKLKRKSGLKTYRSFEANKTVTNPKSLHGSICQIVDGNTNSFDVKSYNLNYINDEYVLELPEKRYSYKNRSELTASGANSNLHACGAIILQSSTAVGVLNFDDKISPVLFSQLPGFGTVAKVHVTAATSAVVQEKDCRKFGQKVVSQDVPELVLPRRHARPLEAPGPSMPGHDVAPLNQAPLLEPPGGVVPEHNAALLNQAPPPELSGAAMPAAPQHQALPPVAAGAAAPGPSAAPQHQAPLPEVVAATAPGPSAPLNQAPLLEPPGGDVPEHNAALLNQAPPPELSGAAMPAPQHQALPPVPAGAAAPGPSVPQAVPKFVNNIQHTGNVMIGDCINATIGPSSTDAGAPQHQAPPQPPGAAASGNSSVPQAVPKFVNNIQHTDNVMIGDHIKATIVASSTDAPPQPPGAAASGNSSAAPNGNCTPTPAKFNNNIQGARNVIAGDHATVNIVSSSRRGPPASNART